MHKFYLTNNLGGGGTNVSRLYDYIELFDLDNVGMLLNYYYLTGQANPSFDTPLIRQIQCYDDIKMFVSYCREYFQQKRYTSQSFNGGSSNCNINGFLLDNGCGNLLRDLLESGQPHDLIKNYIKPFFDFAESMKFDFSISLDLAMKYTYKANEVNNPLFMDKWKQLANDNKINIKLLSDALQLIKSNNYIHKILAPIHGYHYLSFLAYYRKINELENKMGVSFGGFALGGIANTRNLNKDLWEIPKGFSLNNKAAYLCHKLIKTIRNETDRYIHVLGAGNIYALPFIIHAGADSSDCHSAWRRSSDGGINKAKILIPLMNKNFDFINNNNCLEYVKIKDINTGQYQFNCGYTIDQIKNLLTSTNREDFYFGEIIIFYEAMLQYNILIDFIKKNRHNYLNILVKSPDKDLNDNYLKIIKELNI